MISFVIALILFVIAVGLFTFGRQPIRVENKNRDSYKDPDYVDGPRVGVGIGVLLMLIAGLTLVLSSITHVGSNEVGITNNFGTYTGTVGPGVHLVAPWTETDRFTTRIQTEQIKDAPVTLKNPSADVVGYPAKVDYTLRWHIDGVQHAHDMWSQYRSFDGVQTKLVTPQSKTSARVVFGQYLPADAKAGANVRQLGDDIADNLRTTVAHDGIVIDSVNVTDVALPQEVEKRLAQVQAADANRQKALVDADTRLQTAKTDRETADQQAAADKVRRTTATRETLIQDCLRVAANLHQPMDCNYYQTNQYAVPGAK